MNILQEKSLWNEFQNRKSRHDIYALKDSWFVHFLDCLTHVLDLLGNIKKFFSPQVLQSIEKILWTHHFFF